MNPLPPDLAAEEADPLAPARGIFNGVILGLLMWAAIGALVLLTGCATPSGAGLARITETRTVFVTLYPNYQELQAEWRKRNPSDTRTILAFAQMNPCNIHIVAPQSNMDGEFARSFEHELRHCTNGAWHNN